MSSPFTIKLIYVVLLCHVDTTKGKNKVTTIPRDLNDISFETPLLFPPQLTMNDFSVHRIIGRGGFGEVYGCRKADTGKM